MGASLPQSTRIPGRLLQTLYYFDDAQAVRRMVIEGVEAVNGRIPLLCSTNPDQLEPGTLIAVVELEEILPEWRVPGTQGILGGYHDVPPNAVKRMTILNPQPSSTKLTMQPATQDRQR